MFSCQTICEYRLHRYSNGVIVVYTGAFLSCHMVVGLIGLKAERMIEVREIASLSV